MKIAYIDANVIVRLITDDPPDMAQQAAALFDRVDRGELQLVADSIVIAETVWVLSSFYGFTPGQIGPVLREFLVGDEIESDEKTELLQALTLYEEKNVDFADALLCVKMMKQGVSEVYSFDEHFDRLESIRRLKPG